MIRVERIGQNWDVQIRVDRPEREFALVAAAMMKVIPPERMIQLIRSAERMSTEVIDLNKEQSKLFKLRLAHLLEIYGMNLESLCYELQLQLEDCEDLKSGAIPSLEAIDKIANRFNVSQDYLFDGYYGEK